MQAGCYWGYIGLIRELTSRIQEELKAFYGSSKITVVATGGLSSIFSQDLPMINHVDEDLTLKGLVRAYKNSLSM